MQMVLETTRGLGLLVNLNRDRLLYLATLVVALGAGAWLGTLINAHILNP